MQANAHRQEHAASLWHSQSSKDVSGEHILNYAMFEHESNA